MHKKRNPCLISSLVFFMLMIPETIGMAGPVEDPSPLIWNRVIKASLESSLHKETFTYFVILPVGYEGTSERYPVLYSLYNMDSVLRYTVSVVEYLASLDVIPQMIVVLVKPNDGRRDLTPTRSGSYGSTSGGAGKFLNFLEGDLFKKVDRAYRTSSRRLYWSHSIGGTLGIYALLKKPEMFTHILVSSPWLVYDFKERYLINNTPGFMARRGKVQNHLTVLVGREPRLKQEIDRFINILTKDTANGITCVYRYLPEENHQSILIRSLCLGLRTAAKNLKK